MARGTGVPPIVIPDRSLKSLFFLRFSATSARWLDGPRQRNLLANFQSSLFSFQPPSADARSIELETSKNSEAARGRRKNGLDMSVETAN